jgi:hypothetical protein
MDGGHWGTFGLFILLTVALSIVVYLLAPVFMAGK